MSVKLKQITLNGFRGATLESTVSFPQDKKITMIFGENGTGKSSLVDAFAFLCEQSIGSLQDRSGGNSSHLVSVTANSKDLSVALETSNGTWQARLNGASISVLPTYGYPSVRILRRARITRLIEAQAKERYSELRAFIEVPGIEASEKTLRKACESAEKTLNTQIATYTQATDSLNSYWVKEGKPDGDAVHWAKAQKAQDVSALESCVSAIKVLSDHCRDLETKSATLQRKSQELLTAKLAYDRALEDQKNEEKKLSNQSSDLLTLLEKAKLYLSKTDAVKDCPVCGHLVEKQALTKRIETQIAAMSKLTTAKSSVELHAKTVSTADAAMAAAREDFSTQSKATITALLSSNLDCFKGNNLSLAALTPPEENESEESAIKRGELLLSAIQPIRSTLTTASETASATITRRNAIVTYLEQIETADKAQKDADVLVNGLKKAVQIVENHRKDYVTTVLKDISQEVDRLYTFMHPGENLHELRLYLKPKVQGSLELHGNFHTQTEVAPQAYFSESHLDTLGLCIFLALAKKYKTDDTVILLDDVVTSVDSTHLERFIKLIDAECEHYDHVIITTHYRPWRERYRYHQAANSKMGFVELRDWSLERGINVHSTKLAVDELKTALEPGNFERRNVANMSGILLERIFHNLSLLYGLKVPLKQPPEYTLGEFLSAFDKKFVPHLKVERLDESGNITETIGIKPLIDSLRELTWIRNQVGAHFNVLGEEISDVDVRQFGGATLALASALICPVSGELPNKNRQGKCWESAYGRTCLHPLTTPGDRPPGEEI